MRGREGNGNEQQAKVEVMEGMVLNPRGRRRAGMMGLRRALGVDGSGYRRKVGKQERYI